MAGRIIRKKRYMVPVAALILSALLSACSGSVPAASPAQTEEKTAAVTEAPASEAPAADTKTDEADIPKLSLTRTPGKAPEQDSPKPAEKTDVSRKQDAITEDGIYHDLESVVLYYDKFGKLPSNFITKKEAKDLGWEGGELAPYKEGASIGGDYFGNYEKRLPADKGVKYIECDIDTDGGRRGAKRLIISSTGKYYYTKDHYETFDEVDIVDGEVVIR